MERYPLEILSPYVKAGHVQGIAVDLVNGFAYFSFTTLLLKTDLNGIPVGSVSGFTGHLGCICISPDKKHIFSSLEYKRDSIGKGIARMTGTPCHEEAFYIGIFDCAGIRSMDMDAEDQTVFRTYRLDDVKDDYNGIGEYGKKHRYGCSGVDGIGIGPAFSDHCKTVLYISYGIYKDKSRHDNDHQILLEYNIDILLNKACLSNAPRPGRNKCENKYFLYTGNTNWGTQNLEYDPYLDAWILCVYEYDKGGVFTPFRMFFADASAGTGKKLLPATSETVDIVYLKKTGTEGKQGISGSFFIYGQTGVMSLGDGHYYFSEPLEKGNTYASRIHLYTFDRNSPDLFRRS